MRNRINERWKEFLEELLIKGKKPKSDKYEILAFDKYIVFISDDMEPVRISGIDITDIDDAQHFTENYIPSFYGFVDNGKMYVTSYGSEIDPKSSVLAKKVAKQLGIKKIIQQDWTEYKDETEKFRGKIPNTVYHGTTTEYIPGIMKTGLRPSAKSTNYNNISHPDFVFFTSRFPEAWSHATHTTRRIKRGSEPVVLVIKIPDKSLIVPDYDIDVGAENKYYDYIPGHLRSRDYKPEQKISSMASSREHGIYGYKGRIPAKFIEQYIMIPNAEQYSENELSFDIQDKLEELTPEQMKIYSYTKDEIGIGLTSEEEYEEYMREIEDEDLEEILSYPEDKWKKFVKEARLDEATTKQLIQKYDAFFKSINYGGKESDVWEKSTKEFLDKLKKLGVKPKYYHWALECYRSSVREPRRWTKMMNTMFFTQVRETSKAFEKIQPLFKLAIEKGIASQKQKDINYWVGKDLGDLKDFIKSFEELPTSAKKKKKAKKGAITLFEDEDALVTKPTTMEASCFYGKGTKWCIAASVAQQNAFKNYSEMGHKFYFVINKKIDKEESDFYKVAFDVGPAINDGEHVVKCFDASDDDIEHDEVKTAMSRFYGDRWEKINRLIKQDYMKDPVVKITEFKKGDELEIISTKKEDLEKAMAGNVKNFIDSDIDIRDKDSYKIEVKSVHTVRDGYNYYNLAVYAKSEYKEMHFGEDDWEDFPIFNFSTASSRANYYRVKNPAKSLPKKEKPGLI